MLQPITRVALLVALAGLIALALRFYRRQKRGALGGGISAPKMAWLGLAVYLWFLACPLVALDDHVTPQLRWVLGAFALSMWIRGIAELYMLYVSKNWRPPYGVAHDVLCLAIVAGGLLLFPGARPFGTSFEAVWQTGFVALIFFSLCVETVYALLFFDAVKGKTTGEEGVWFAAEDEARFRRINRLTFALNVPQYGVLLALLGSAQLRTWVT